MEEKDLDMYKTILKQEFLAAFYEHPVDFKSITTYQEDPEIKKHFLLILRSMQHILERVRSLEQADALLKDLFNEVEDTSMCFDLDD